MPGSRWFSVRGFIDLALGIILGIETDPKSKIDEVFLAIGCGGPVEEDRVTVPLGSEPVVFRGSEESPPFGRDEGQVPGFGGFGVPDGPATTFKVSHLDAVLLSATVAALAERQLVHCHHSLDQP